MTLENLVALLTPFDAPGSVWHREPLPDDASLATAVAHVIDRERARVRARAGTAPVHRIMPPRLGDGWRAIARAVIRSGVVIEPASEARTARRPIDDITGAAGASATAHLSVGWEGGVTAFVVTANGPAVLRMAAADGPRDPGRAADGLRHAAAAALPEIPRLLGRGVTAGFRWTLESRVGGRIPRRLTIPLLHDAAALVARLPRDVDAPGAFTRDLATIAALLPHHLAASGARAADIAAAVTDLPAVMAHGDLWRGNLLVEGGHLSGVVDWDSWQPDAVPGVDPLHLVTTEERHRKRHPLGTVARTRPWRSAHFAAATTDYWRALRCRPDAVTLDAIGWAWWAAQIAADLRRRPALAGNSRWVSENVDPLFT